MESRRIRQFLEQEKGKEKQIKADIVLVKEKLTGSRRSLLQHEEAREIIREVGLKTQQQLQYQISDITSLALGAIFDNPYELSVTFTQRRNKTECDLFFTRDENSVDPLSASGGGTVDVAAFALRVASWSMQIPRNRNTIILDEPLKNLSPKYREKGSRMLKEISTKLGLQFIIVNHEPILTAFADKVFRVEYKKHSVISTELT